MALRPVEISDADVMKQLVMTVTVRRSPRVSVRYVLARSLLWVLGRIAPFTVKVRED